MSNIAAIGNFFKNNPEFLEKVCNVLPELADSFKEIAVKYPELANNMQKMSQENMAVYNEMCKIVLNELQKILDSGEVSEEDRRFLIDKMFEVLHMQSETMNRDKEIMSNNLRMVGEFLLLGPLGIATEFLINKNKEPKEVIEVAD